MANKTTFLRGIRWPLVCSSGFGFISSFLQIVVPIYSLQVFDRVIPSSSLATLVSLTIITACAIAVSTVLDGVRSVVFARAAALIDDRIYPRAAMSNFTATPDGPYMIEADTIRSVIQSHAFHNVHELPWAIVALALIFFFDPAMGMVATVSTLTLGLMGTLADRARRLPQQKALPYNTCLQRSTEFSRMARVFPQSLSLPVSTARRVILLRTAENFIMRRAQTRVAWIEALARGLRGISQIILIGVGSYVVLRHQLGPGLIIASSMLYARAAGPIERFGGTFRQLSSGWKAWRHICELELPSLPTTDLPKVVRGVTLERAWLINGPNARPSLRDITLSIQSGEVTVVVGAQGAGKSALGALVAGCVSPTSGVVLYDGSRPNQFDQVVLGRQVGYLPQIVLLHPGTIAEVIAGEITSDSKAVIEAAKMAGADSLIRALPDGYDTDLTKCQDRLSGGARTRIGLARAFYNRPSIVVLDEPMTWLDEEGESILMNAIGLLKRNGACLLVISNHQAFLQVADHMVMIEKGEIKLNIEKRSMQRHLSPRIAS